MTAHHRHASHNHARHRPGGEISHSHAASLEAPAAQRALIWALIVTGGMALVEVTGAVWSGSLALLSDGGHMATDAAALGLALFASRIAQRPPTPRASFGSARAVVL